VKKEKTNTPPKPQLFNPRNLRNPLNLRSEKAPLIQQPAPLFSLPEN
jgi:hypothetical protein